jgi:hypothetical protein
MLIVKQNSEGIDKAIERIQIRLNAKLATLWTGEIGIYGRIENLTKGSEVYISDNEYRSPFLNDKQTASIAFDVQKMDDKKATVNLICTILLPKAYGVNQRSDNKALMDVYNILKYSTLRITDIKDFTFGTEAFKGLDIKTNHREMNPWFIFSINFELNYKLNC